MAKHAELSPSSAERWLACPGSVVLSDGLPNPNNDYSDEGTASHYLASVCLTTGTNASEYQGREIYVGDWGEAFSFHTERKPRYVQLVDRDFTDPVQNYIDYVREVVASTNGKLHVEQRLSLEGITGEEEAEGTSDAVIVTDDELIVIDLKFGQGVMKDAESNPQLMMYGLAAVDKYGIVHDFNDVRVVIHQPRLNHVSEHVYSLEEMDAFRSIVADGAARVVEAKQPHQDVVQWLDKYTRVGEEQCRFCLAKATCPTLTKHVVDTVGAEFSDLTEEGDEILEQAKHLDPEALSERLKAVDVIEGWCKAVRSGVEGLLLSGVPVPDFKLVQGKKGHRKWTSADEAEKVLKSMRLKEREMYDFKLISPTTAEKLLKTDSPKRWTRLQTVITQTEGSPSVAPASDKREALVITPASADMEDLTEPDYSGDLI